MTDKKIETPEPPPQIEPAAAIEAAEAPALEPAIESPPAPAITRWSAARSLEAFMVKGSERFSAALVLGLSAATLVPGPPDRETFAAAVPPVAIVQAAAAQHVAPPPVQLAAAKPSAVMEATAKVKPVLKGRPKVTLKNKWAKSKNVILLRATKDVPGVDVVSLPANDLPILSAKAPAIQIAARTAKRETVLANAAKTEAAVPPSPISQEPQGPLNVWPEEAINSARAACETMLKDRPVKYRILEPMKEGACGTPAPISLQSAGETSVSFQTALTINCETAAALATWIDTEVQPAAKEAFGVPVKRLLSASSYSCRHRYGRKDAPLSEHATANAIDIFGFVLADGRTIKVVDGWGPTERDAKIAAVKPAVPEIAIAEPKPPKTKPADVELLPRHPDYKRQQPSRLGAGDAAAALPKKSSRVMGGPRVLGAVQAANDKRSQFLKRIHSDACGIFGTVLGPESNHAHRDHLHLDMKSRSKAYCE